MKFKNLNGQIVPLTAAEEAQRDSEEQQSAIEAQALTALIDIDKAAIAEARTDATIKYLVNHAPMEIDARIRQLVNADGITTVATAKAAITAVEDLLVRFGIALSVIAKDKLR